MEVKEIMTTGYASVQPSTTLSEAVAVMVSRGLNSVPVTEEDGHVVGFLSIDDFAKGAGSTDRQGVFGGVTSYEALERLLWDRREIEVREVMSSDITSVGPEESIAALVDLMVRTGKRKVPVVTDGRLSGIVSEHDLLKVMTKMPGTQVGDVEDRTKMMP